MYINYIIFYNIEYFKIQKNLLLNLFEILNLFILIKKGKKFQKYNEIILKYVMEDRISNNFLPRENKI